MGREDGHWQTGKLEDLGTLGNSYAERHTERQETGSGKERWADRKTGRFVNIRKQIDRKAYRETRDRQWEGKMGDGKTGRFVNIRKQIGRKANRETRGMQWEGKMGRQENWKICEH